MKALLDVGVIPVVRCDSADAAIRVTDVLVDAGLPVAEITFTVPDAVNVIAKLARRRGVIGAGTVTTAEQARAAIRAGAEFIVSPGFVPEVIEVAKAAGVTMIPGALTPTEILNAQRAGADLIKVFPVQSLGGASYVRALRGPFPDIPLVPTGGVDLGNVAEFIRAGAAAVGVGSELISRQALAAGNYAAIAERAALFVAAVAKARRTEGQCS